MSDLDSEVSNDSYINYLAARVYDQNKEVGWWDDPNRCLLTTAQLILTEVAEATEGARKNLMDDHLPHRPMEEVELADALIRTVDLGAHCGLVYEETDTVDAMEDEFTANLDDPAALHFLISCGAVAFGCGFLKTSDIGPDPLMYSALIDTIIVVARLQQFDLRGAVEEKLAYNAERQDHKRENRAAEHGKKF